VCKIGNDPSELGKALGITFQQIQKYENGGNAVASTRIPDLRKILEISPNDLFGVSARMDSGASQLGTSGRKLVLKVQELSPGTRQAVGGLIDALSKR
jgi:transcriptional regulator with XRE-family HTH domain